MNKKIDRIEAHLRRLFEDYLIRIFSRDQAQHHLIDQLMQALQENLHENKTGKIQAPDLFVVHVHPQVLNEWRAHQDILDNIADSIFQKGKAEGFYFSKKPEIIFKANPRVPKGSFTISTHDAPDNQSIPDTAAMTQSEIADQTGMVPQNAFLIIRGSTNFPLQKPVVNVGRHSENDLILQDPHISRHHAQLRAINHRYVIFDVGSTGGIYLNEKKITRASLHTGDVIRLGTIHLIYSQDPTSEQATTAMPADSQQENSGV